MGHINFEIIQLALKYNVLKLVIVLIFGILLVLKILSYIILKSLHMKSAERELLRVDTPKDHKRSRKPKCLSFGED